MKKIILVAMLTISGFVMNAQDFKAGLSAALPIGDAEDASDISYGIDMTALWYAGGSFEAGATLGYSTAPPSTSSDGTETQFLPIAGAVRYNVSDAIFLGTDVGYAIGINDGNDGGFYYRPKVGYLLSNSFSVNLSYTGISIKSGSWNTVGLGIELTL